MGPRSCERGNGEGNRPGGANPLPLQWGRARASAEMSICVRAKTMVAWLQWGRARASAEMRSIVVSLPIISELQWGRARASAEITDAHSGRPAAFCFNGAALVRARKWAHALASRATLPASMGPRSCERGNGNYSPCILFPMQASMGPRSCERGNACLSLDDSPPIVKLQWGRARASAEMTRFRRLAVLPLSRLQWGRARASAEIQIDDAKSRITWTWLQWGRARASAEMLLSPGEIERGVLGFNGAALVRARK